MTVREAIKVLGDAFLGWIREPTSLPTVSTGEAVFSPFIYIALAMLVRNGTVMYRLWRRVRDEEDLAASAKARFWKAVRALMRVGSWGLTCWALLTDNEYRTLVFTAGILFYGLIEVLDAALDWKYDVDRNRYWETREKLDDYADRLIAGTKENTQEARAAAQEARQAAVDAKEQTALLGVAIAALTELVAATRQDAQRTYTEANDVNVAIRNLGMGLKEVKGEQAEQGRIHLEQHDRHEAHLLHPDEMTPPAPAPDPEGAAP